MWNSSYNPPDGLPHKWTQDVIVVTNYGNTYKLAYMHGSIKTEGYWQRPSYFISDEEVIFWTENPLKD